MKVRFHLPDFTQHFHLNYTLVAMLRNRPEFFREGVEIASFFGAFPQSIWNGGRNTLGICDMNYVKQVLNAFNSKGIPLRFTFTNPALEKRHLHDKFCNDIMKLADNGLNEVIVNSPLLEDYIREKYPDFKLTSSTCKRITEPDELAAELEKDYKLVVVDYDFNNKFELLEQIPHKEKCELLINPCCDPNCKMRKEHYRRVGLQQIEFSEHAAKNPHKPLTSRISTDMGCGCGDRTIFDNMKLPNNISPEDIWNKYVPMGFEHFKIEGRTATNLNMIETYMYYLIKPEFRDEARFNLLYNLEKNGAVRIG